MNGRSDHQKLAIRLVATDLDGTLLHSDRSVSDRTRKTLARLMESGVTLTFVTGRPPRFVAELATALGLTGAAICCNGALCYDLATGALMDHSPIAAPAAAGIVGELRAALPGVTFAVERGLLYGSEPAYQELGALTQAQDSITSDAISLCAEPVTKLIARLPGASAAQLYELVHPIVGERATVSFSGPRFVEMSAPGVDKGTALARLCATCDISPAEVVAFGDMPNDAPMLRWAGLGIAVANAHAEAVAAANERTLANDEDGVAQAIESLFGW